MKKTLLLIPGSTAEIGKKYLENFSKDESLEVYGFTSNENNVTSNTLKIDFLNKNIISKSLTFLNFNDYKRVILLHCIGEDKFEDWGYPINKTHNHEYTHPKIYASNFLTFKHIADYLVYHIGEKKIKFVALGGTRDELPSNPYQQSYSNAKKKLRSYMKKLVIEHNNISSLMINVSSINTGVNQKGRPYSDTSMWLTVDQLIERSKNIILLDDVSNYFELTLFNPMEDFDKNKFYSDYETYKRRLKEVYNKTFDDYLYSDEIDLIKN